MAGDTYIDSSWLAGNELLVNVSRTDRHSFEHATHADNMTLCHLEGRPDMYGLGIRLACYAQWFSVCVVEFIHEKDLPVIRLLGFLLSFSITVDNIIQIASHDLEPVDINICLVLSMGIFILVAPVYAWRIVTCFNQYLDPLRSSEEIVTPFMSILQFALLITNTGIGIWFYTTYLPLQNKGCDQYGFFLSKMKLWDKAYIAFGSIFFITIILCCIGSLIVKAGWAAILQPIERPRKQKRKIKIGVMHEFRAIGGLVVFALLVAAVELPIRWNKLSKVNDITTPIQTIPLFLTIGFIFRVLGSHLVHHTDCCRGDDEQIPSLQWAGNGLWWVPVECADGTIVWGTWDPYTEYVEQPRRAYLRRRAR